MEVGSGTERGNNVGERGVQCARLQLLAYLSPVETGKARSSCQQPPLRRARVITSYERIQLLITVLHMHIALTT